MLKSALKQQNEETERKIEEEKKLRGDEKLREKKNKRLEELNGSLAELKKKVEAYAKNDPEVYEKMKKDKDTLERLNEAIEDNFCVIDKYFLKFLERKTVTQ